MNFFFNCVFMTNILNFASSLQMPISHRPQSQTAIRIFWYLAFARINWCFCKVMAWCRDVDSTTTENLYSLWVVHTASNWDRDWNWERNRIKWVSMQNCSYCMRPEQGAVTGKFGNSSYSHFSGPGHSLSWSTFRAVWIHHKAYSLKVDDAHFIIALFIPQWCCCVFFLKVDYFSQATSWGTIYWKTIAGHKGVN